MCHAAWEPGAELAGGLEDCGITHRDDRCRGRQQPDFVYRSRMLHVYIRAQTLGQAHFDGLDLAELVE
jgi:hypothetical protein